MTVMPTAVFTSRGAISCCSRRFVFSRVVADTMALDEDNHAGHLLNADTPSASLSKTPTDGRGGCSRTTRYRQRLPWMPGPAAAKTRRPTKRSPRLRAPARPRSSCAPGPGGSGWSYWNRYGSIAAARPGDSHQRGDLRVQQVPVCARIRDAGDEGERVCTHTNAHNTKRAQALPNCDTKEMMQPYISSLWLRAWADEEERPRAQTKR